MIPRVNEQILELRSYEFYGDYKKQQIRNDTEMKVQNIYIILFAIGLAFGVLNILTPEYLDDYLYKFIFLEDGISLDSP